MLNIDRLYQLSVSLLSITDQTGGNFHILYINAKKKHNLPSSSCVMFFVQICYISLIPCERQTMN